MHAHSTFLAAGACRRKNLGISRKQALMGVRNDALMCPLVNEAENLEEGENAWH